MKMPAVESEAKAKTKVRFEEIFKSHADLADKKKLKKKALGTPENIVLETFKNHLGITQESENDEVIINDTYNPEERSPRITKSKLRHKASVAEKINNNVVSGEESVQTTSNKKKKKTVLHEQLNEEENLCETKLDSFEKQIHVFSKKKTKSVLEADAFHQKGDGHIKSALNGMRGRSELDEEEQLIQAYEQQVAEEEANAIKKKIKKKLKEQMSEFTPNVQSQEMALNNEVSKKKKKKKEVSVVSEAQTSAMSLSELQNDPEEENTRKKRSLGKPFMSESKEDDVLTKEQELEEDIEKQKSKGKKPKRKPKKVLEENTPNADENTSHVTDGSVSPESKPVYDDSLVLGVYIHRTDRLKTDLMVSHPMVKVHVIDQKTGLYAKKENSSRSVSSFYEQEKVGHILPIMTQPYDFKQFKSTLPEWEELIIFNERFNYFLQDTEESPRIILFFEILDFLSMNDVRTNFDVQAKESGFRKISWAFLKLVGANGVLNVGGKLRLQLYCPPPRSRSQLNIVEIYDWWAKCPRNHYPSTLYVTIKGIKLPEHVDPSLRSMMAVQQEYHSPSFLDLQSEVSKKANSSGPHVKKEELHKWSRFPGQVCRIPNKHLFSLRAGDMGCFCIRFSEDGRTLAAGCAGRDAYPIILYEIPSGQNLVEFYGHLNIVYDLCWSKDNQHLLTASSDGTARMWKIEAQATSAVRVFPHPSFVYTAKYHPVAEYIIVTGCYDSVIRVWNAKVKDIYGQLLQEFDGHKSFINTLCFDAEGFHMFSGDSTGLIIIWNTLVKGNSQSPIQNWGIDKEINDDDFKGTAINHLEVHPNGRRLLIHTKDSTVRIMDLRILATKKYIGATNYREKIRSTLTPCGTFLFSGSEDGIAYVWNPETGDQVAMYSDLSFTSPVRDVAFHPHEHMVSFCAFGQNQPILVYIYDYKVAQQEAELVKDFRGLNLSTSSRGPQIFSNSADISGQKDSMSPADQFASAARMSLRMQKVKQKLDSVMTSSSPLLPSPSLLSPHSKLSLASTLGRPPIPLYPLPTQSGSFIPVGNPFCRSPSAGLHTNAEFPAAPYMRGDTGSGSVSVQETVVALYDYTAHRSDELTIHCSDIIQVLYKDNDNWWFGSLANGQQGYFPANYVVGETQYEEQLSSGLAEDSTPLLFSELGESASPAMPGMSAYFNKSGDQRFISENDTDYLATQSGKRKTKKKGIQMEQAEATECKANATDNFPSNDVEDEPKKSMVKKRKKRAVKTASSSGTSNDAFQLDSPKA
ncbi:jouberin isoform X1 [Podarcis raffonei]|uniref:jouberin isoform X1 n=3 Tax=Podarcis raffonei TaxID=65483 RepID=UPI00232984C7|nr:jouberin isoform X1 [Podarcis raffonei]XP_053237958.1 jouberin isoform X1 [Podarcis raffonei]XP_053237959.1 jouberin isoform X1 [Podarcis raffonei]XP_053237960.1 jouberin isoform X1 [Podarcis raffonei]XP_053237961.1 jouberin isoform X1 [Podarcis raffonei]